MGKWFRPISIVIIALFMVVPVAWAVPAASAPETGPVKTVQSVVQNIRYSQGFETIRIVLDVTVLPVYTAHLTGNQDQLIIDLEGVTNNVAAPPILINDAFVSGVKLSEVAAGKQQVIVDLQGPVTYRVFTLKNPNRVVVDVIKQLNQRSEVEIAPKVKHISFIRTTPSGMISAHAVDMAPGSDYMIKPILSNDAIVGLEKLQSMAERNQAVAAVNASYFALNGEILGLLKIDGAVASTSTVERTALGILPDGKIIMDQLDYKGSIKLPDGRVVAITGVNHERGPDDLILYNNYYDSMTGTNVFGSDYLVKDGKIIDIAHGSAAIPPGGFVLAAHGTMEKALAGLKVGDAIKVNQTLGTVWDKTIYAIGAGPRLVKDGKIFVTGNAEEFPADITSGRAPRTAVGVTKDGHIILVVVDGRQQSSIGMTLEELALFMQEMGAADAMNLDGGGSSEMVIGGDVINNPSDGHERSVGDALLIVTKN